MNTTDATPAADRGSECNALLGPTVPDNVMAYLHVYGDSRADDDGRSGLRIGEAIVALRRWAAELQAAERERWRAAAEYAAHQLEQARIWNGMDWHYNPLHPLHYRSALERLRDVLRA